MNIKILEYDEGDLISEHSILNANKDKAVEMILKYGTGDNIPDWINTYYNIELGEINIIIELKEDEVETGCNCDEYRMGGDCECRL